MHYSTYFTVCKESFLHHFFPYGEGVAHQRVAVVATYKKVANQHAGNEASILETYYTYTQEVE